MYMGGDIASCLNFSSNRRTTVMLVHYYVCSKNPMHLLIHFCHTSKLPALKFPFLIIVFAATEMHGVSRPDDSFSRPNWGRKEQQSGTQLSDVSTRTSPREHIQTIIFFKKQRNNKTMHGKSYKAFWVVF
jgi:hypothetical protein